MCWITKQLRENIREMKFWNFSRDSWLFTGMNVVSHFLFLAGIKVVKISFFFPARPDRVELLIDLDSAPRKSAADSQNTMKERKLQVLRLQLFIEWLHDGSLIRGF